MQEISAQELKAKIDAEEDFDLVDVRNQGEFDFAKIDGAKLIPFGEIMQRADEFDSGRDTVVMCRSGVRSARVIEFLKSRGYEGNLFNLAGGILAWSDQVDPSVPKY